MRYTTSVITKPGLLTSLKDDGASWTWTRDYIWGPTALLATVSREHGTKHYVNDHLGSPRLVCDRGGAEKARHTYWPFGEEFTPAGQDRERIKFTGHERDLNNGRWTTDDLDYMHARHYNLHLGRFLSVDPIGGSIGSSQSWNRYSYVHGNPINARDPDGRASDWAIGVNAFNKRDDKPQWTGASTPEQRAVNMAIMGPFAVLWSIPVIAAVVPADMVAAGLGTGATGLVIGGLQEAASDHPIDVKVRNTMISGGVAAVGGPVGEALGGGGSLVRSLWGTAAGALGAGYTESLLKQQGTNGSSMVSVVGSSTNAMVAQTIANAFPRPLRSLVANVVLVFLEIEKSRKIRDLEGDFERNQDTPLGGVPSGVGYDQ